MAIQFSGGKKVVSASNYGYGVGQSNFSLSFWLRHDSDPTSYGSNSILLKVNNALLLSYVQVFAPTTNLIINNDNWPGYAASLSQNTWYHIALTWASGSQKAYVNGTSHNVGTVTGQIDGGSGANDKVYVGDTDATLSTNQFTIDSLSGWNGYVLTSTDISNIRSGAAFPDGTGTSPISTAATFWHKLNKTSGTVSSGDAELTDTMGHAPALSTITGSPTWVTGTAPVPATGGPFPFYIRRSRGLSGGMITMG